MLGDSPWLLTLYMVISGLSRRAPGCMPAVAIYLEHELMRSSPTDFAQHMADTTLHAGRSCKDFDSALSWLVVLLFCQVDTS